MFAFELPVPQLRAFLAEVITPELSGFTYNGEYLWYSPWNDHCRKVVRIFPLKGTSAVFQWGLCFDFLPIFGERGRLYYQRTEKSVGLQLFCWPPGHWNPHSGSKDSCRFSRMGKSREEVEHQLLEAFYEAQTLFLPWFQECQGLCGALAEARRQSMDLDCRFNWPAPDYVTAFLLAASGELQQGMEALEGFWSRRGRDFPPELYEKLKKRLSAVGRAAECRDW